MEINFPFLGQFDRMKRLPRRVSWSVYLFIF